MGATQTTQRTQLRKAFLHTVFTTAVEGGINYWSTSEEYHWSNRNVNPGASWDSSPHEDDIDGFYAIIDSSEGEWGLGVDHKVFIAEVGEPQQITDTQSLRIDLRVVERGVNLLVDKVIAAAKSEDPQAPFSNKYLRQFVEAWLTDGEDGDFDADGADLAIQLGLFGEVVYG